MMGDNNNCGGNSDRGVGIFGVGHGIDLAGERRLSILEISSLSCAVGLWATPGVLVLL